MLGSFLDRWLTGWRAKTLVGIGLVVLILLPPVLGANSYVTQLLLTLFVFAVFGHAWNLLAGYCGLLSFGNQVYVGIAGFTMGILVYYGGVHVWVALPIAGLVSAAFAYLLAIPVRSSLIGPAVLKPVAIGVAIWIGYEILVFYDPWWDVFGDPYVRRVMILLIIFLGAMPLLTLEGAYFAVATWLIAAAVGTVFNEWKLVGAGGGMRIPSSVSLEEMYYVGLILLVFATWVIRSLLNSRVGLALTAVRDDAEAAATVGVDVAKVKLLAFVLSGGLTGLAASLYFIEAVSLTPPSAFTVIWSAYFVFVVVAGGMGSLSGPIVGALIFVVIDRLLSGWLDQPLLVLGLASVIVILVLPRGVIGMVDVLRRSRDARSAWRELFEATALADLIGRLGRRRRGRNGNTVVAAFLVPGTPLPLLRPEAPGWKALFEGCEAAARSLARARPDVLLVYSTQWVAVLDQLWQTRPRVRGIHVDENWHAFGDLVYDFDIDAELAQACIDQSDDIGVRSKPVNYDRFPIDTGTIVAANLLNPESRWPLAVASNNLYHDGALTGRLAALAVQCAADQGKRVALIGVGGLSGAVHRREIDPAEDSFAGDADDHWNCRLLEALIAGDASQLRALLPDYAANARADMGMKHLEWLLGGMGPQWCGAFVHAYGPVWGSGAAVVELALDDRLARRGRARGIPTEAKRRLTLRGAEPETGASSSSARAASSRSRPLRCARRRHRQRKNARPARPNLCGADRQRFPVSQFPQPGGDRRAIRCRGVGRRFRSHCRFLPVEQRAGAAQAQARTRYSLRPDDGRASRSLSGPGPGCAAAPVHSRRLLAFAEQQGVQFRRRGAGRGRRRGRDPELRSVPECDDDRDRAPEPGRREMAVRERAPPQLRSRPDLGLRPFRRRPPHRHADGDGLGRDLRCARGCGEERLRHLRPVRPCALRA